MALIGPYKNNLAESVMMNTIMFISLQSFTRELDNSVLLAKNNTLFSDKCLNQFNPDFGYYGGIIYSQSSAPTTYVICVGLSALFFQQVDDGRLNVLFNSVSIISGRREGNNERLYAFKPRLRLTRFPPPADQQPSASPSSYGASKIAKIIYGKPSKLGTGGNDYEGVGKVRVLNKNIGPDQHVHPRSLVNRHIYMNPKKSLGAKRKLSHHRL